MDNGIILYLTTRFKNNIVYYGVQGYRFTHEVSKKGSGCPTDYLTDFGYYSKSLGANKEVDESTRDEFFGDESTEDDVEDVVEAKAKEVAIKEGLPTRANAKVGISLYYEIAGHFNDIPDSYAGELTTLTHLLEKVNGLIDENTKTVIIYTDITMAVNALAFINIWPYNNWTNETTQRKIKHDTLVKKYFESYNAVADKINKESTNFKLNSINYNLTNQGIDLARCYLKLVEYDTNNSIDTEIDAKGYWKSPLNFSPLIKNTFLYYQTNQLNRVPGEYFMGANVDLDRLGHRVVDCTYSYIKLNTPDAVMEKFINVLDKAVIYHKTPEGLYEGEDDRIVAINVNELSRPRAVNIIEKFNNPLVRTHLKRLDYAIPISDVCTELYPPKAAWRAFNAIRSMKDIHDNYVANTLTEHFQTFDITHEFYALDSKNKNRLKPSIDSTVKDFYTKINYRGYDVSIPIYLGIDTLERNGLKNIELLNPKVAVIAYDYGENAFKYFTYVSCDEGSALYAGYFSNTFFTHLFTPHHHE